VLALYRVKGAPRPPAVIPVLIELLRWQDPTTYDQPTRNGAALRLGELGQAAAPAIPVLIESLGHRDALVRYHALRGLAGIGVFDERVVPAIARALADPAPAVRRQAVVGLEQMGDAARGAGAALERAQDDEDPAVRERARRLLRRLAG
jgi:HEAT repeat protein